MSESVPMISTCCHRPSWALVAQALEAERDDIREGLEAEYTARGLAVLNQRYWAFYRALGGGESIEWARRAVLERWLS